MKRIISITKTILFVIILETIIACFLPDQVNDNDDDTVTSSTNEQNTPEDELNESGDEPIQQEKELTQSEVNAAVLELLEYYVPHIVNMNTGLEQVLALMDAIHNTVNITGDTEEYNEYWKNNIISASRPDKLIYLAFTDDNFVTQCSIYSYLIFDSLKALGYDVRLTQFFMEIPDGHNANEVKIGDKLYALDALFNFVFIDDDGNILSNKELKQRILVDEKDFLFEYVGNTNFPFEIYANRPYKEYFIYKARAFPWGIRPFPLPELDIDIEGQEFY